MRINLIQQNNYNPKVSNSKNKNKNTQTTTSPVHSAINYSNAYYNDLVLKNISFGSTMELEATKKIAKSSTKKKNRVPIAQDFRTVSEYKKFTPDVYQKEAIENLIAGNDVIVSAPTGTGKTLIAEEIILENLRKEMLLQNMKKGKQTFYTAPLKAVVDAKFKDFQNEFGKDNVARLTGDYKTKDALKYPIVVMTTEVYRNMMLTRKSKGATFEHPESTVVFDELHYMGDMQRGSVWEEAIMLTPPKTQILGLSATISNDKKLVGWIQSIHTAPDKNAVLVSVPRENRHVPLHYFAYNPNYPNTISELEAEGISAEIFENSSLENVNLSEKQKLAIQKLNQIYQENPVVQGHKILNRIRNNYDARTVDEFEKIIKSLAEKAGVKIPTQSIKSISARLVTDNKAVKAAADIPVKEYRLMDIETRNKFSPLEQEALEYLDEIGRSFKVKDHLHKQVIPAARGLIENIAGVNDQKINFDDTLNSIKQTLNAAGVEDSDKFALELSKAFKVKKPNPLIDFINNITLKKEILFSDENAETIIQRRLELAFKKQGLSEEQQRLRAKNAVETLRNAFCSFYNDPQIDTISKAINYSDSQYVTKHLIQIPIHKNIDAKKIAEIKQRFTPEEIKVISLYGFISNHKLLLNIKQISDIQKFAYNDTNFIKGARLISSYSSEKIKTKENFMQQVIAPKFIKMEKVLSAMKDELLEGATRDNNNAKRANEIDAYIKSELSPERINQNSNAVLRAMLEKNPRGVIKVKDILTKIAENERIKQEADTSAESFMFRLPKEDKYTPTQYTQLKTLGEFLKYKKTDRGAYVLSRLKILPRLNTEEQLRAEIKHKMEEENVSDIDSKIDAIIRAFVKPLSPEEISLERAKRIRAIANGKIKIKAADLAKITPEQAVALKKLTPLYEYLNTERQFVNKSDNNPILNSLSGDMTDQDAEVFKEKLAISLENLQEENPDQLASEIAANLKSKVLHKSLGGETQRLMESASNGFKYIPNLVESLQKEQKLPAIFFIFSRKQCEDSLKQCTKDTNSDLLTQEEKIASEKIIQKYMRNGEMLDPNFANQKKLLLRGYAVHHAGRMPAYKSLVQELSEKGLIKVTFATETLAAGINFPTRTTVITRLLKPESDNFGKIQSRNLKASELQQMAGRAGRRGYDKEGFCIIVGAGPADFRKGINLAERAPEAVESHYKPSYGLVANLLMDDPYVKSLDDHFAKSFLVAECSGSESKERVQVQLQSRTNDIMEIMLEKGYIKKVNNYGKYVVTAKGQLASLAKGVNEILLTDLVTDPKLLNLNDIDSSMFAGIVSSITYDSSDIQNKLKTKSAKIIKDEYASTESKMKEILDTTLSDKITEIIEKEKEVQKRNPAITDGTNQSLKRNFISFNKWMSPFIYQWARCPESTDMNEFWTELTAKMQKGGLLKDPADFTRNIKNTVDLLEQIETIADIIDIKDFYEELNLDPVRVSHIKGLAQKAQIEMLKMITKSVEHVRI